MQTAIHFGAGNIGRGFIGALLAQSDYKVIFADIQQEIVKALQEKQQYIVEVVGENKEEIVVKNVDAISSDDPKLVDAITGAGIITTAVGPNILKFIAPTIARAIEKAQQEGRTLPLSVIACENAVRATSQLKAYVVENMAGELPDFVHFIDAAVDRIVPPMEPSGDVLKVRVEEFYEWLVEKAAFQGNIPDIKGMTLVDNLEAGVERKLFTLNTGHAVCAWIGQYLGFNTIGEAIADKRVYAIVKEVMEQSGAALIQKHHFDSQAHSAYIKKILNRFANPYIVDDVERVGRQPIRKLSKGERIASPMKTALQFTLPADKLLIGAAAAMHFNSEEDPQVAELQAMIKQDGVQKTFEKLSDISFDDDVLTKIYENLDEFI